MKFLDFRKNTAEIIKILNNVNEKKWSISTPTRPDCCNFSIMIVALLGGYVPYQLVGYEAENGQLVFTGRSAEAIQAVINFSKDDFALPNISDLLTCGIDMPDIAGKTFSQLSLHRQEIFMNSRFEIVVFGQDKPYAKIQNMLFCRY